jgi:hypothetical protein
LVSKQVNDTSELSSIRQLRPELALALASFRDFAMSKVEPATVELCRLRILQVQNGQSESPPRSKATQAAGITDAQLHEVANWRESGEFDEAVKACLAVAEYFSYTAQAITDEHVAEVAKHLSAEQILTLVSSYWATDASSRLDNFLSSLEVST